MSAFRHMFSPLFVVQVLKMCNTLYICAFLQCNCCDAFSHHWQGSIDFNTVNTIRPTGMYFLIIPRDGLMMREWPYTASNRDELYTYTAERRDVLGCTSPPTQYIPPLGSVHIQYLDKKSAQEY